VIVIEDVLMMSMFTFSAARAAKTSPAVPGDVASPSPTTERMATSGS
jgi:hypothetical protein